MKQSSDNDFRFDSDSKQCYDKGCDEQNKTHFASFTFRVCNNTVDNDGVSDGGKRDHEYLQMNVSFNRGDMSSVCRDFILDMEKTGWEENGYKIIEVGKPELNDQHIESAVLESLKKSSIDFCEKFWDEKTADYFRMNNIELHRIYVNSFEKMYKDLSITKTTE